MKTLLVLTLIVTLLAVPVAALFGVSVAAHDLGMNLVGETHALSECGFLPPPEPAWPAPRTAVPEPEFNISIFDSMVSLFTRQAKVQFNTLPAGAQQKSASPAPAPKQEVTAQDVRTCSNLEYYWFQEEELQKWSLVPSPMNPADTIGVYEKEVQGYFHRFATGEIVILTHPFETIGGKIPLVVLLGTGNSSPRIKSPDKSIQGKGVDILEGCLVNVKGRFEFKYVPGPEPYWNKECTLLKIKLAK